MNTGVLHDICAQIKRPSSIGITSMGCVIHPAGSVFSLSRKNTQIFERLL
jgi:hypothetical protein